MFTRLQCQNAVLAAKAACLPLTAWSFDVAFAIAAMLDMMHRWFWTSQMREDEAYVFVNYDSRHDGRARFTPHSTIVDPNVPEDAPIRQSIETRAFVFWGE